MVLGASCTQNTRIVFYRILFVEKEFILFTKTATRMHKNTLHDCLDIMAQCINPAVKPTGPHLHIQYMGVYMFAIGLAGDKLQTGCMPVLDCLNNL